MTSDATNGQAENGRYGELRAEHPHIHRIQARHGIKQCPKTSD